MFCPAQLIARVPAVIYSSFELRLLFMHYFAMASMEELAGEEWAEWYRLTPAQRWTETEKLWRAYLQSGGSLDPEPDTQSPFFDPEVPGPNAPHGRPGVRIIRRCRI